MLRSAGQLRAGNTVVVVGDDDAPVVARVLAVDDPEVELTLLDESGPERLLRGAHAGPGPSSEQARAAERARDEETTARRLAALDGLLPGYETAHGRIDAEEMEAAVQRLRARRPGGR